MSEEDSTIREATWSDLPPDLLDQIFRRLTFPDTRRMSAVCKLWRSALESEPPAGVLSSMPWLMVGNEAEGGGLPKGARRIGGSVRRFFNPVDRRLYEIETADFERSVCHAAVGDWLLQSVCGEGNEEEGEKWEVFFLNPFTRVRIDLPGVHSPFDLGVCSVFPTCTDCMVVLVEKGVMELRTTVLKVHQQKNQDPIASYTHQITFELDILDAVYCGGLFYLYGTSWMGRVLSFNPNNGSLIHLLNMFSALSQPLSINLVESLGRVLVITRGDSGGGWCRAYRLDFSAKSFTRAMEELEGQTMFIGAGTSMSISAIGAPGGTVYFSKCGTFEGGMCEFRRGNKGNIAALSPLDHGLYGLPGKRVSRWPVSLSEDGMFDDNMDRLHYIRVPRVRAFANSSGEWFATGGIEGVWVQAPLY
ncbi:hypothetical protein MRB53_033748 [Persea americana]|uniref:Uncharacterized protein n=1 Tax=Persea americana TaxID=3435 RepID=A0ACC2KVT8_PERAE|nr:hypothetical protein MRB53_033748 [Persea americana]